MGGGFRVEGLERRELLAAPVLDPIANVSVPANKTLMIPLTATDADGNPLHYTVSSTGTGATGSILSAGDHLKLSVAGFGDMTFQLLPEFAPNTVSTLEGLVKNGFYDGLTFHRVVNAPTFKVIQGGDPNGNGTGGPGFKYSDEFNASAIFSGSGQLANANSGRDTNGSQFFVTIGATRSLDFGYTIWGQLQRGFDVLSAIDAVPITPVNGPNDGKPVTPVVITSASIVPDTTDSVLLLKAGPTGSSTVTVTVDDGHGGTATRTFTATAVADTTNDQPFLADIPNQSTPVGTPVQILLSSTDLEGDPVTYTASITDATPHGTVRISGTVAIVTPEAGYTGPIHVKVGVQQTTGATGSPDTQVVTVTVGNQVLAAQATPVSGVAGQAIDAPIATFTASIPYPAGAFTATIQWGDGTTSQGTVTAGTSGNYTVTTNNKTFDRFGSYTPSITITDTVSGRTAGANTTATIADAPISAQFAASAPVPASRVFSGALAVFADANAKALASDLSATIQWGDGTTTPGSINKMSDTTYSVTGTHTYAALGNYAAKVTILSAGGSTATASGTVSVPNHAPTFGAIAVPPVNEGSAVSFSAAATDADPGQHITYSLGAGAPAGVTIDPATGLVSWTPPAATTATVTVVATDDAAAPLSTSQVVTIPVTGIAPTVTAGPAGSIPQFGTFSATGKFTDPGTGPWTATVDYGDGSGRQALALGADRSFTLSHAYAGAGSFAATVAVTDASGLTGTASVPVQVAALPTVRIVSASPTVKKKAITMYTLKLSDAIDASATGTYSIVAAGRDKRFGTRDDLTTRIKSVSYVPTGPTITLAVAKPLKVKGPTQLRISGLRDRFGRAIAPVTAAINKAGGVALPTA